MSPSSLSSLTLRGRLLLYMTLVSCVPLLTLTGLQDALMRQQTEAQIESSLRMEAEGFKDLLESTLAERESSAHSWAEDPVLRGALRTKDAAASDAMLALLQRRYLTLNGIVLFNDSGGVVSASAPALRDAYAKGAEAVRQAAWFREAQTGRTTAEGVEAEDPIFSVHVLPLAVPVMDEQGQRLGVLLAAFDWGQVKELVKPALARAQQRGHRSFSLEVRGADGRTLFNSGKGARDDAGRVSVVAVDGLDVRDVGDGWKFIAQVDPEEAYAPLNQTRRLVLGLAALFVAAVGLGSWVMARGITRPLRALSEVVRRVVKEGDLTQVMEVKAGRDEVGELTQAFGQMMKNLHETATSLQQGTRVLSETVAELNLASEVQERNVARQAAALQETQVTAQEIKQTSLLAAEKAETVLGVAARAEEVGRAGEVAIRDSLGGFQGLHEQSGEMAMRIVQLNERTQQIGGITQTVKDLADQSNMLALNAAIEAVRSGEHGKGFSVVAREIRNLADQSIQATEKVRDILGDLGHAIISTAKMTEQSHSSVAEGLEQVRTSGDHLKELATIVQDNAAAARQIAGAVNQQNAGIAQIFSAVTDLSSMMAETQASLRSTTGAAKRLQEVAGQMEGVARSYRI
ncbi:MULTISPECIES: methyl-accepting chemotaxis protein [Corallococcus]|uniref:methyl-accepting chemotaxis protein n=1 Tax=Corallococcus TaxID=83461 RepID=UPI00117D05D1|nr:MULTISPECIES: methyl-accepting chemotaxis protein [Corallococcus]NBD13782.1 HAMP domain-containing protein [Corallococcus silvisoli]TSC22869.1 methyl-accepting chemotaxis protein [Corallococcus sp. Z5C101001]